MGQVLGDLDAEVEVPRFHLFPPILVGLGLDLMIKGSVDLDRIEITAVMVQPLGLFDILRVKPPFPVLVGPTGGSDIKLGRVGHRKYLFAFIVSILLKIFN